jgi:hypothetical protein
MATEGHFNLLGGFMIDLIMCVIFQRRHRYNIQLRYLSEGHTADVWVRLTCTDRGILKNSRSLKKRLAPDFLSLMPKEYLGNGIIAVRHIQYLGWF